MDRVISSYVSLHCACCFQYFIFKSVMYLNGRLYNSTLNPHYYYSYNYYYYYTLTTPITAQFWFKPFTSSILSRTS